MKSSESCDTELRDRLVVLTGASSGIGRAAALAFASAGARLVLAARDREALETVVSECSALGARAIAVPTDVSHGDAVQQLAEAAADFGGGRIDIWINNAGVGSVGAFDSTPMAAHEQVLQTDLLGYLRGAHAVLPYFKAQGGGTLINTLSVGSWVPQPYAVAYSAAKFGLRGFSEALRAELVEWPQIHICDLFPAVIDTPGFRDGANYAGRSLRPPPPVADPRRVAEAMLSVARRPRRATTVGATAHLLRIGHALLPGFNALSGRLTGLALRRARRVPGSSGNLFHPATGERRIDGGWRAPGSERNLLLAGTLAAALLGWWLVRRQGERERR